MPFQSEKQRRYLWANEPEIARDWTDTYGSRIEKNDGGIMRLGFRVGGGRGMNRTAEMKQDTGMSMADIGGGGGDTRHPSEKYGTTIIPKPPKDKDKPPKDRIKKKKPTIKEIFKTGIDKHNKWNQSLYNKHIIKQNKNALINRLNKYLDIDEDRALTIDSSDEDILKVMNNLNEKKDMGQLPHSEYPGATGSALIDFITSKVGAKDFSLDQAVDYYSKYQDVTDWNPSDMKAHRYSDTTNKNILTTTKNDPDWLKKMATYEPTRYAQHKGNITWNPVQGKFEPKAGGEGPIYYPGYVPGGTPGSGGGGGTTATEVVEDTPSAFQESLTTSTSSPFDYYVGQDPTAKNLAWGQKFGVDPRTMYRTSWAADGGRIPAAYGGIMDTDTGRRAYGFGSFFSKIGKAAKKVLGSKVGKAALLGGVGFGLAGYGPFQGLSGLASTIGKSDLGRKLFMKQNAAEKWVPSWGKLGIAAAGALPFFMGGGDEDEDEGFDYEGAKNKYWDELMRIKAGAMAGSLDTNKFNYLGVKDGGRIGMYAGGQSTPSDYTMEDAMMTTTQDKLGGITDVMKQADLNRQGSVGQFYAAHGGSPSDTPLMDRVKELEDEGLDFASAMAQAIEELQSREDNAQGGRIGYAHGSAGYPPVTMGQVPQAPQMPAQPPQRPHPMPAPQPNRMAMNPMMNRPMMNPMGGRRMAQEGGLMDLGGMEKDYRNDGGFVPLGGEEKADDVPARLSKNEFVFTADAVRGAGDGDIDKGAEIMENIMKNLEQGGQISEETQGLSGAQEMFGVSERLGEVL